MYTLNCKGRLFTIDKPVVMGIINVTPDSFYQPSRQIELQNVLDMAESMINNGATILDVGGQSTRPGSDWIDVEEELDRVIDPIKTIHNRYPDVFISVDTFYAEVAKQAVAAGASIVNDISAGSLDKEMISTVARLGVPFVCMHMMGTPQNMHLFASYDDVAIEVLDFLIEKTEELRAAGIKDIIIDPGIGFAKTAAHNFELMTNLGVLKMINCPLLLGLSRKSFIRKTLDVSSDDDQVLIGTAAMNMMGLLNGASILRVHDVREATTVIQLYNKMSGY